MIMTATRQGAPWETQPRKQLVSIDPVEGLADWRFYTKNLGDPRLEPEDLEKILQKMYSYGEDVALAVLADYWDFSSLDGFVDLAHSEKKIEGVPDHWPYAIGPGLSVETKLELGRTGSRRLYQITLNGIGMNPSRRLRAWTARYGEVEIPSTDEAMRVLKGEGAFVVFIPTLSQHKDEVLEFFSSHRIDAVETTTRRPERRDTNIISRMTYHTGFGPGLMQVGSSGAYPLTEEEAMSEMFLPMSLISKKDETKEGEEPRTSDGLIKAGFFYEAVSEMYAMKNTLGHHIFEGTVH